MTRNEYYEKQRQEALRLAPPDEITEVHFRACLCWFPSLYCAWPPYVGQRHVVEAT